MMLLSVHKTLIQCLAKNKLLIGDTTMSNIHFFLQGKGGVGKTLSSSITAQYLKSIGQTVECFDTDSVNHTLMQYKSLNAKSCEIYNEESGIDDEAIEAMAEYLLEECKSEHVIIDNGAISFIPMMKYLVENEIIDILCGAGNKVFIHTIVTGGQGLEDTARGMVSVFENFKHTSAEIVVWLNYKFGDVARDGLLFSDWNIYKDNKKHIAGVVEVDFTQSQLFQRDLDYVLTKKITFDEACSEMKLFSRNRVKSLKDYIFASIENSGVKCFANAPATQTKEKKETSKSE